MLTEIHIYYEGHADLRAGFSKFLDELIDLARQHRCRFKLISGGSREAACKDFGIALTANRHVWSILLIDSECPLAPRAAAALCRKRKWDTSNAASIFWMVQMMESWFHADKNALKDFYGAGFNENALKSNPNVEDISKQDLKNGLSAATKDSRKGNYFDNKTQHGPKLLETIKPALVQQAAPNCKRLFTIIRQKLS